MVGLSLTSDAHLICVDCALFVLLAVLLVAITIMMFLVSSSMGLQIGQSTGPTRRAVIGGAGAAFVSNFAFPALPAFAADVDTAAIMKAKAGLQAASHAASCNSQPAAYAHRHHHPLHSDHRTLTTRTTAHRR